MAGVPVTKVLGVPLDTCSGESRCPFSYDAYPRSTRGDWSFIADNNRGPISSLFAVFAAFISFGVDVSWLVKFSINR